MSHTPGPWVVTDKALRGWEFRITASEPRSNQVTTIADVPNGWNLTAKDPETKANAQLIAAAPELLAALRAVLVATELLEAEGRIGYGRDFARARAAIAKAEGRE